jgi:hypothetical protein
LFALNDIVPWGRSFDEYFRMFALDERDLRLRIVDCGGGPASFNAGAARRGAAVISCDPLYRYDAAEIRARIDATFDEVLEQTRLNAGEFVWTSIRSVEELGRVRRAAMQEFLGDYPAGRTDGRYVDASLPALPFADGAFDLALSSHFLFLYTVQLGEAFHLSAIREMCRVAAEVRVFPLLALGGAPSPYVDGIVKDCRARGLGASIDGVPYEFQKAGNRMLRIRRL